MTNPTTTRHAETKQQQTVTAIRSHMTPLLFMSLETKLAFASSPSSDSAVVDTLFELDDDRGPPGVVGDGLGDVDGTVAENVDGVAEGAREGAADGAGDGTADGGDDGDGAADGVPLGVGDGDGNGDSDGDGDGSHVSSLFSHRLTLLTTSTLHLVTLPHENSPVSTPQ